MAVSFIQEADTAQAPASTTMPLNITASQAGSLLVVGAANDGNPITSITDNQLNTYTQIGSQINNGGHRLSLWYCLNATAGVTQITSHQLSSPNLAVFAAEYSGTIYGLNDTSSGQSAGSNNLIDSGPFSTGVGNLIVGFAFAGAGVTQGNLQNFRDNSAAGNFGWGDTTSATGGHFDVTFVTASVTWSCIGASFATPGPGGPFGNQIVQRRQLVSYRRSGFIDTDPFGWTQFLIIPPASSWNTDLEASNQLAQPAGKGNLASDGGLEWTNSIVLPPWDPSLGTTIDDPADNQKLQLAAVGNLGSDAGQDTTNLIILPPPAWDTDADNQKSQLPGTGSLASDSGQDSTGFLIIPSQAWNTDSEKDNQLAQLPASGNLASDSGQDTTNFLIIPSWDPSLGNTEDDPSDNQLDRSVKANEVASDSGQDTTNFLIVPAFDPHLGNTQDNDQEQALNRSVKANEIASDSGQDSTGFIILPPMIATEIEVQLDEEAD